MIAFLFTGFGDGMIYGIHRSDTGSVRLAGSSEVRGVHTMSEAESHRLNLPAFLSFRWPPVDLATSAASEYFISYVNQDAHENTGICGPARSLTSSSVQYTPPYPKIVSGDER